MADEETNRVRVNIRWDAGDYKPRIQSSHPIPDALVILNCIPQEYKKFIERRFFYRENIGNDTISSLIANTRDTIPFQVWADAIGAATMTALSCQAEMAQTEMAAIAHGGYLAIGNSLYKLSAVGVIDTNKALVPMRRKILDATQAQADATLANAKVASEALATQAARTKHEADEYLRQAHRKSFPPYEMTGGQFAFRRTGEWQWAARLNINFRPRTFAYEWSDPDEGKLRYVWRNDTMNLPQAISVGLWVPFNVQTGEYTISSITVDDYCTELPHVAHTRACMEPSTRPEFLKNHGDLSLLQSGIQYCLRGVELHSLLVTPNNWLPTYGKFFPPELKIALEQDDYHAAVRRLALSAIETVRARQRRNEELLGIQVPVAPPPPPQAPRSPLDDLRVILNGANERVEPEPETESDEETMVAAEVTDETPVAEESNPEVSTNTGEEEEGLHEVDHSEDDDGTWRV